MSIYSGVIAFKVQDNNVSNHVEFWTFLHSQILLGALLPKVVPTLSRLPRSTSPV